MLSAKRGRPEEHPRCAATLRQLRSLPIFALCSVLGAASCSGSESPSDNGPWVQVAVGRGFACALDEAGYATCWGSVESPPQGELKSISAKANHACAITSENQIACWIGNEEFDDVGQAAPPAGDFTKVSAGEQHSCGLAIDSTIVCWGLDSTDYGFGEGRVNDVPEGAFESVAAGWGQSCAIGANGSIACWGEGPEAESRAGSFSQVAVGPGMTCSIEEDGSAECWGGWYNEDEGMAWAWEPDGAFIDIDGGDDTCAIGSGGAIECHYGVEPWFDEAAPPDGTFADLAMGGGACAVGADGDIACWGSTPRNDGDAPEDRF
ncbi:MAG: hypothetical protein FJ102_09350 [Deltaproteobacteria bacterium]|nr:hypothetical protein [Deltaproteobacteria bacterium]